VRLLARETFVPLSHRSGHAQADFGEADGYIGGKKVRFHYFCMDLPHSDGCFVKAYPAETAEAFCDGHVAAFAFFGGVAQSILYDNSKLAVAKIVRGGKRQRSKMFAEGHYLFEDRFGRPGKGNDKGKVEGLVGFVRRNFMTPPPVAESFNAFNARLLDACTKRRQAILRGHRTTIAERMQDCGLEWDVRSLHFHRMERQVRTASKCQVRRPIYTSSVGRWHAYQSFLAPLFAELEPPTGLLIHEAHQ
jgi:transposase